MAAGRMMGACVGLALLAACGSNEGQEVASGTVKGEDGKTADYSVRQNGDDTTMTVKSEDGEAVIRTGGDVAGALPEGLALYPGATVTNSIAVSSDQPGKGGAQVSFETVDPAAKVVAWYRAAAEKAGYKIETELTTGDLAMVGGRKGEGDAGKAFQLMVNKSEGKSIVTLIAGHSGG